MTGPAGLKPSLETPEGPLPLCEVRPGVYGCRFQPRPGEYRLEGQTLGQASTGALGLVEVTRDGAVFRTGPTSDYDRLTPLTAGVRFEVLQRQGEWLQVDSPSGWIRMGDTRPLEASSPRGNPVLEMIQVREPAHEVVLRLGAPCAWQVREDVEQRKLLLELPSVPMALFHIAYSGKALGIPSLRVSPSGQGTLVEIPLRHRLWGYSTQWDGRDLHLRLTPQPPASWKGLRVTLDPGHGGQDDGTVGLELHKKEKDLNLAVALALRSELTRAGANVSMTREADHQVAPEDAPADQELQARVELAERKGAQLFLSIHHNARPDVKDGRVSHGTHVYYYQPHSRGLASAIAAPLARAIGEPACMHLWRSFHVIRQTRMPAVLVEVNFLSNPTLEKGMMSRPDYARRAAHGIRMGAEEFLRHDD